MKTTGVTLIVASLLLGGCHGSEETTTSGASDVLQQELAATRASNDSLKLQMLKLEQEKRAAAARAAELEAQAAKQREAAAQTPPPPPQESKPVISNLREGYARALDLYRSRNYAEAGKLFQAVLDGGAPVDMQDNCYYWMGECAYGEKNYAGAIEYFRKIFTFTISEKKDESQIMIANSYYAMGDKAKAKAEYERLVTKFPASPYVKKAKARLAGL